MIRLIRCAALALMLMPATGATQDFDVGRAAAEAGDFATALREWTPLAELGDVVAQYNLGAMYDNGQRVPQDHVTALMWSNISAANGNTVAATNRDKAAAKLLPADIS